MTSGCLDICLISTGRDPLDASPNKIKKGYNNGDDKNK